MHAVLGVDGMALAVNVGGIEQWRTEQLAETVHGFRQCLLRNAEVIDGIGLVGGGIETAARAGDEVAIAIRLGIALAAQVEHVLEEMRQAGHVVRVLVAAGLYQQRGCRDAGAGVLDERRAQAVVQSDRPVVMAVVGAGNDLRTERGGVDNVQTAGEQQRADGLAQSELVKRMDSSLRWGSAAVQTCNFCTVLGMLR